MLRVAHTATAHTAIAHVATVTVTAHTATAHTAAANAATVTVTVHTAIPILRTHTARATATATVHIRVMGIIRYLNFLTTGLPQHMTYQLISSPPLVRLLREVVRKAKMLVRTT